MHEPRYAPFPAEEYRARQAKARRAMAAADLDALLVTGKENVIYFTGLQTIGWESKHRPLGAIIPADERHPVALVIPETLMSVAHETSPVEEVRPWGGWRYPDAPRDPIAGIVQVVGDFGLDRGRIGLELGYGQRLGMSQNDYDHLRDGLANATLVDGSDVLWDLRMIKSPREIAAMRRACEATSRAFQEAFEALHEGMSEMELAAIALGRMGRETGEKPAFVMVRSGATKYSMVNVCPFDRQVERGDLVVVDLGATYKDYKSDFMRMASIGGPSPEQQRFFEADLAAQQAGVAAVKPGVATGEVFDACYRVLIDRGFEEHARLERIGHGLGLDVHEPPSIGKGTTTVIQPGMILTVEPIFSDRPNYEIGNFALEDVLVVTEDGCEILSAFPKDLWIAR